MTTPSMTLEREGRLTVVAIRREQLNTGLDIDDARAVSLVVGSR